MDTWSWGPNTVTAVSTVVTAVVAIAGFIYAIVERRRVERAERPDVSGNPRGGMGLRKGDLHWVLKITTTIRNPSRRTVQLVSVTIEQPPGAGFVQGNDVRPEARHETPITPFGRTVARLSAPTTGGILASGHGFTPVRFRLSGWR
jgi:hypothetical protein